MFGMNRFLVKTESKNETWLEQKIGTYIKSKSPVRVPMFMLDQLGKRVTDKATGEMVYDDNNVQEGWIIISYNLKTKILEVEKPNSVKLSRRPIALADFVKYNKQEFGGEQ